MHKEAFIEMINQSLVIGITAAVFTFASLNIIKYLKRIIIIEKYSDFIAGVILIIFGFNMIL